jgi:hypothetical protein
MKNLKIKLLFTALLAVSLWSCSNEAVEAETNPDTIVNDQAKDYYYDYEVGDADHPYLGEESLNSSEISEIKDFSETELNAGKWWWIETQDHFGGHTLDRHWNKALSYLLGRKITNATTFSSKYLTLQSLNSILLNSYDGIKSKVGRAVGSIYSQDFVNSRTVGYGVVFPKKTVYTTRKFRMVLKRVQLVGVTGTTVIVLTCFPVL